MKQHLSKIAFALIAVSILMGTVTGCKRSSKEKEGTTEEETGEVSLKNIQSAAEECSGLGSGQFCIGGMDFLKLGDSLVWNNNIVPSVEAAMVKDTVFEEIREAEGGILDTVAWFVKMVTYPDGMLYLEQDFENPHLTGRIRIETDQYAHPSGLKVGSRVKDIVAVFNEVIPSPFPEYGVMELVVPYSNKRMIFHVPLGDYYQPDRFDYDISEIPEDSKVTRIVLM
ncbi:MAG: hypothetical protein AAF998_03815 [Bacteroidota bacterium]